MKITIVNLIKDKIDDNIKLLSTLVFQNISRNKVDHVNRGLFYSGPYIGSLVNIIDTNTYESLDESLALLKNIPSELNRKLSKKQVKELSSYIVSSYTNYANVSYTSNIPNMIKHIPNYPKSTLELHHSTLVSNIENKALKSCEELHTVNKLKRHNLSELLSKRQLQVAIISVIIAAIGLYFMFVQAS